MKILFAARDCKIGGPSTFLSRVMRGLIEDGHEVHLAAQSGQLVPKFEKIGVHFHRTWPTPFNRFGLSKLIRQESFDIIHALNAVVGDDVWTVMQKLPAAQQTPYVVSVHGKLGESRASNQCLRTAQEIIAFDAEAASSLEHFSFLKERQIHRVARPVEPRWDLGCRPAPADDEPKIVILSRMSKRKSQGALATLEVAPKLRELFSTLTIDIVGEGSNLSVVRARAKALNANGQWIKIHGSLVDPFTVLKNATVVVGTAYVALESLYHEIPVVGAGYTGFGRINLDNLHAGIDCNFGDSPREGLPAIEPAWMLRELKWALELSATKNGKEAAHDIANLVRQKHDYRVTATKISQIYQLALQTEAVAS